MILLNFLIYFVIGLQVIFKPNRWIELQIGISMLFTAFTFNFHAHLMSAI